jgi:hypothetical protein
MDARAVLPGGAGRHALRDLGCRTWRYMRWCRIEVSSGKIRLQTFLKKKHQSKIITKFYSLHTIMCLTLISNTKNKRPSMGGEEVHGPWFYLDI